MSLHDTMAAKAFAAGKTSDEFSTAAQRHANASWAFALFTGATWYFADWVWALIPAALTGLSVLKSVSSTTIAFKLGQVEGKNLMSTPEAEDVESIIQAYGQEMEKLSLSDKDIPYDLGLLPFPKSKIKAALLRGIEAVDDPNMIEQLKGGYVSLSDWQDTSLPREDQLAMMSTELIAIKADLEKF